MTELNVNVIEGQDCFVEILKQFYAKMCDIQVLLAQILAK